MYLILFSMVFYAIMATLMIFNYKSNNKNTLSMRKEQSNVSLREHHIKKVLESSIENKSSYSKKYKIETMCNQAGLKITYGEYKILQLICAILLPILCLGLLKNQYLGVASIFIGMLIPNQIVSMLRNKRTAILDKQIGSFLQMVTERYSNTKDFSKALTDCLEDFKGSEPFYTELRDTILEMQLGVSTSNAIKNLSNRTGNKYLNRLGDYYALAIRLGTTDARNTLLKQAFYQYDEDRKIKNELKMAISGPANEAYIMIGFIPVTMIYNACTNPDYIPFMTQTELGKIGVAIIFSVISGCLWMVSSKLSAPID